MTDRPEISVVVATHARETRLGFMLDAFAEQTLDPDRFEVIVVRSREEGPLTATPDGVPARFLTAGAANISIQRNLGWRAARAPLVAFTDDDCRPTPVWLEALLATWTGGDEIVQGLTRPDPDEEHLEYGIAKTMRIERPDRWFQTCNIAYPRSLLERLGGFDEALAFHCEDTDLALRAERLGAVHLFEAGAEVHHAVHVRGIADAVADATRLSGEPALLARYPAQRELLYLRTFVHSDHARLVLALAGLAVWPRSRAAALAAAYPYFHVRLKRRFRRGFRPTPAAPARAVLDTALEGSVDAVEVAMRLRASLRARRLVL